MGHEQTKGADMRVTRNADVAKQHQLKIAKQTLRLTQAGARILGGMSYHEAYFLIYGVTLSERLADLRKNYTIEQLTKPFEEGGVNWELDRYGYRPVDFID